MKRDSTWLVLAAILAVVLFIEGCATGPSQNLTPTPLGQTPRAEATAQTGAKEPAAPSATSGSQPSPAATVASPTVQAEQAPPPSVRVLATTKQFSRRISLPDAPVGLGIEGPGHLWVFGAHNGESQPDTLTLLSGILTDSASPQVTYRFPQPAEAFGISSAGTAVAAFSANGGAELTLYSADKSSVYPLPSQQLYTVEGVAPLSSGTVWVVGRKASGQELQVGEYHPGQGSLSLQPITGTANEGVMGIAAAQNGAWVATGPRPVLYWVPESGALVAYPLDARMLGKAVAESNGDGWLAGSLPDGSPEMWKLQPGKAPIPVRMPPPIDMLGGLAVGPDGTGYAGWSAVGGGHGLPGFAHVSGDAASLTIEVDTISPDDLPGGGVGSVAVDNSGHVWCGVPFSHAVLGFGIFLPIAIPPLPTSQPAPVATSAPSTSTAPVSSMPELCASDPTSGPPGTSITMTGQGFGSTAGTVQLLGAYTAGFTRVANVVSWSDNQIVAQVPADMPAGEYIIAIEAGGQQAGPCGSGAWPGIFTVTGPSAHVTGLTPSRGKEGIPFTITGTGFGSVVGQVQFCQFCGTPSQIGGNAQITSWSDTQIQGVVPRALQCGVAQVWIICPGSKVEAGSFTAECGLSG